MRAAGATLLACLIGLAPVPASAQDAGPSPRQGRLTLSGGMTWLGGYPIGDSSALLRSNARGSTPPPFTLFRAETSVDRTVGGEARVGFALTRSLTVETGVSVSRPSLTVRLSQDDEAQPATLDAEQLSQFIVDAGVVWQLPAPVLAARLRPFVSGGGGYLRQLYDEHTLVETGQVYYVGGGMRYWIRGGDGVSRGLGVRGDVRALWRRDGVEFEGQSRVAPTVTLMLFWEP